MVHWYGCPKQRVSRSTLALCRNISSSAPVHRKETSRAMNNRRDVDIAHATHIVVPLKTIRSIRVSALITQKSVKGTQDFFDLSISTYESEESNHDSEVVQCVSVILSDTARSSPIFGKFCWNALKVMHLGSLTIVSTD